MVVAELSDVWILVAILCSYALGAVPGAAIVARRHGVDLRTTGDGNPGAWNVLEQLGWGRAWPAFVVDGTKGLLAAALGWVVVGTPPVGAAAGSLVGWLPWEGADAATLGAWPAWACVGAAMLGHAFPPWSPRQGGKSVMAFCGGAIGLVPLAALPLAVVAAVMGAAGRGSLGARIVVFSFPVAQAAVTPLWQVGWTGMLMTLIGLLFLVRRPLQAA
ncbi:MAG: glycerol-3-phosphate acyltransferase [Solirubrobacteraceae bacterium]|nr:glycerol-3-phosphate acyltransferase [Solirubrobacteraceae bacterium]